MSAQLKYIPEDSERAYYQGLFKAADVQGQGQIGGAEAVQFFTKSKLPLETLKQIWTVADQPPSNSLDLVKFAVAVRLIQCTQNGQRGQGANLATPAGVVMRPAMFEGVSGTSVPLPPENDATPPAAPDAARQSIAQPQPPAASGQPQPAADPRASMMTQQHQQPSTALAGQDPYGMSPQDVQRMEPVFKEYAKEDGFVYGAEAVALFGKSGMPQEQLAAIWKMVDSPVDNRLDRLEFAMAMHLIVCVTKKNMPMPAGLPPSLQQLKQQPPAAPPAQPSSQTPAAPPAAQESVDNAAPAPAALGAAQGGMDISDAFEGLSTEPAAVPEPEPEPPAPAPEPVAVQPQVVVAIGATSAPPQQPLSTESYGATAMPPQPAVVESAEPPAPATSAEPQAGAVGASAGEPAPVGAVADVPVAGGSTSSNGDSAELNQMKELMTKLQAENISLNAQLSGSAEEERGVQQELAATIAEVARLSSVLSGLRQEVSAQKTLLTDQTAKMKAANESSHMMNGGVAAGAAAAQANLYDSGSSQSYGQKPVAGAPAAYGQPPAPTGYGQAGQPPAPTGYSETPTPSYSETPAPGEVETVQESVELTLDNAGPSGLVEPSPSVEMQPTPGSSASPSQVQQSGSLPSAASINSAGGGQPGQIPSPQDIPEPQSANTPGRGLSAAPSVFGFNDGDYMGSAPLTQENSVDFSAKSAQNTTNTAPTEAPGAPSVPTSAAPTSSPGRFEEMRKKAKEADDIAREAEQSHRTLLASVTELQAASDAAEAAHTKQLRASMPKDQKKKGMFGGGKKQQKKDAKLAEQMAADAKAKKDALVEAQNRANEAQTLAMDTRREAEKLSKAAEDAELAQASANSLQQQPISGGAPQQPPTQPQQQQYYQQPPQQQVPPQQTPPLQQQAVAVNPDGGLNIPTPPSTQPYANPFG